ncbi:MAG: DUF2065 domain-containing protein [Paracoccaceae bacterium]
MIRDLLFGLGCVAVIEGLVLALAPTRLEQVLEMLREIGAERLRMLGLVVLAGGIVLIWLARS